jgi:SAM-dependent methyltransferase
MDDIPYDSWGEFIQGMLHNYNIQEGLVLDLGCGTGTMTEKLAGYGYDMIGIDNSTSMLEIAKNKKGASIYNILYLLQDMEEFELYGTVRAVICVCDSINYILDNLGLKRVFRLVDNYLDPKGLFIFDFNTDYKYREVIGNQTIAENREDKSFIWENYYYEEERINEIELSLFIKEDLSDNGNDDRGESYRKYKETHHQRAYYLEEIKEALEEAGLMLLSTFDDYTCDKVHEKSQRIVVVASSGASELT